MSDLVTLTFRLNEDVAPDIFASRIAMAAARGGALRPGDAVLLPSDSNKRLVVSGNAGPGTESIGVFQ